MLPKASLLGNGVSLSGGELLGIIPEKMQSCSLKLKIHDLRIPTLIGLNANERLAKQMVVTSLEIDNWVEEQGHYVQIEQLVVKVNQFSDFEFRLLTDRKVLGESSYQTLEALAMHLGRRLIRYVLWVDNAVSPGRELVRKYTPRNIAECV